jgi:hypothetical protein
MWESDYMGAMMVYIMTAVGSQMHMMVKRGTDRLSSDFSVANL